MFDTLKYWAFCLGEMFSWIRQRDSEANAPDVRKAKINQQDCKTRDQIRKALEKNDIQTMRNEDAE